jgi:hypothetical protein
MSANDLRCPPLGLRLRARIISREMVSKTYGKISENIQKKISWDFQKVKTTFRNESNFEQRGPKWYKKTNLDKINKLINTLIYELYFLANRLITFEEFLLIA